MGRNDLIAACASECFYLIQPWVFTGFSEWVWLITNYCASLLPFPSEKVFREERERSPSPPQNEKHDIILPINSSLPIKFWVWGRGTTQSKFFWKFPSRSYIKGCVALIFNSKATTLMKSAAVYQSKINLLGIFSQEA